MPKRKGIVTKRLQWMMEAKKQRRDKDEKMEISSERSFNLIHSESEVNDDNNDGNVPLVTENEIDIDYFEDDEEEVTSQEQQLEYEDSNDDNESVAYDGIENLNQQQQAHSLVGEEVYIEDVFDNENDVDALWLTDGVAPDFIYIDGIPIPTKQLVDPRNGDGMVLEVDSEDEPPYLAEFNGNYNDLHQVCGLIWETEEEVEHQITVGITTTAPEVWGYNANKLGKIFVAKPTRRTKACRSVITALQQNLIAKPKKAFSFKLYVRTKLLAEKVKGIVRKVTKCIHKGEAVDDLNELEPFIKYILVKIFNQIELMPPCNQHAVLTYLQQIGWPITTY